MALSAIPLCLLRVIVLHHLALERDWYPMILLIPTFVFIVLIMLVRPVAEELAPAYLFFSWVTLGFYAFIALITVRTT